MSIPKHIKSTSKKGFMKLVFQKVEHKQTELSDSIIKRSFVIPVLDFSTHSPYNIRTLLNDFADIDGEVICIFNSNEVFEELKNHSRIDKFCYNKLNAGVSRSWNIGINMAEGDAVFILNADLHVFPSAIEQLEDYLFSLNKAVLIGPQGSHLDYKKLCARRYFSKGTFNEPVQTDDVSGFFFAIHRERFLKHHLMFDVQFSPCFFEEWDMGLQIKETGLASYAVPITGFEHEWGASQNTELCVNYFGRNLPRSEILPVNKRRFIDKWRNVITESK